MKTLKISTLLIATFIISNNIVSQINVYKPFPQVYGHWSIGQQHFGSPSGPQTLSYHDYVANGDTVVGAFTYKKVTYALSQPSPFSFGPHVFKFAYRNDIPNKKVYYLDVTGGINKDTLWYNFNLNVGDTIKNTYAYSNQGSINGNQRNIVTSIDSILICSVYYKRFNVNCSSPFTGLSLIEGQGFEDRFVQTGFQGSCPFEPADLYDSGFSSCDVGINEINIAKNNIHIYPNPVTSDFKINTTLPLSNYTILNNLGEIMQKGKYTNQESILFSEYLNGLYLINIQDEKGNTYHIKFIKQ